MLEALPQKTNKQTNPKQKNNNNKKGEEKKNALVATMFRWLNYAVEDSRSIRSCSVVFQMEFLTVLIFALGGYYCFFKFLFDYFPPFNSKGVGCVKIILTFESICCSV